MIYATLAVLAAALPQSTSFEAAYDYAGPPGFLPVEILPTEDGGFLLGAVARPLPSDTITPPGEVVVAKFDANGVREWRVARPDPADELDTFYPELVHDRIDIDVDPDGNVYLLQTTRNASKVVKYTPAGDQLWETGVFGASPEGNFGTQLDASVAGQVVIAGHSFFSYFFPSFGLMSLDGNGAVQWQRGGLVMMPLGIGRGPQGQVYTWGPLDTVSGDRLSLGVNAVQGDGTQLWNHFERNDVNAGVGYLTIDGTVDAAGNIHVLCREVRSGSPSGLVLLRLDPGGNRTLFATPLAGTGDAVQPTSFGIGPNGDYFVTAAIESPSCVSAMVFRVLKFSSTGALVAAIAPSVLGACEESRADRVALEPDGSITVVGVAFGAGEGHVLARFDASSMETYARRWSGLALDNVSFTGTSRFDAGARLALDTRGNALTATAREISGSYPSADLAVDLIKTVEGVAGTPYCGPAVANSTGQPAELTALGSSMVAYNNVSLAAFQLPPGSFVLFLASQTQAFFPAGGSQGNLCLGGAIGRYVGPRELQRADTSGRASLQLELTSIPQPNGSVAAMAGERWNFQAWYRDANPQVTSNLTDGVSVQL